jgi:hypothetical protein
MISKRKIEISRADDSTIQDIITICKQSFPLSAKENSPRKILKKKWKHLIKSQAIEVYVILVNNKIAGFSVLIVDLNALRIEKKSIRFIDRILYALGQVIAMLFNVNIFKASLKKAVKTFYSKSNNFHKAIATEPKKFSVDKLAWYELAAISIDYQGMGLGKRLYSFIVNRACELSKEVIVGRADDDNVSGRALFEKLGYILTAHTSDGQVTYKKFLYGNQKEL